MPEIFENIYSKMTEIKIPEERFENIEEFIKIYTYSIERYDFDVALNQFVSESTFQEEERTLTKIELVCVKCNKVLFTWNKENIETVLDRMTNFKDFFRNLILNHFRDSYIAHF